MITFVIALLTIVHWTVTALKEEAVLMQTFPQDYLRYKQKVPWRIIPGVF
jgi:protein-S-isoprenylcysteine O-methyltransferase Ste14